MDCNFQIHDELKNMGDSTCPFCDRLLVEFHKVVESCCGEQDTETANGMNICVNCGLVHGYDYVTEYFNFYDNMHRIRRKSVYNRKYRIQNHKPGPSYWKFNSSLVDDSNYIDFIKSSYPMWLVEYKDITSKRLLLKS